MLKPFVSAAIERNAAKLRPYSAAEEARRASSKETEAEAETERADVAARMQARLAQAARGQGPWAIPDAHKAAVQLLWTAGTNRDEERVQELEQEAGILGVNVEDIKSIQPGALGNGNVIMGFLTLAAAQCGDGQVRVVDPQHLRMLRNGTAGPPRRREMRHGENNRVNRWLYPVHDPAGVGHWTLWAVDRNTAAAMHYDSMGGKGEDAWEFVRAHVTSVTPGLNDATIWRTEQAASPRQAALWSEPEWKRVCCWPRGLCFLSRCLRLGGAALKPGGAAGRGLAALGRRLQRVPVIQGRVGTHHRCLV